MPDAFRGSLKTLFYNDLMEAFVNSEHKLVRVEVAGGAKPQSVYSALRLREAKMSGVKVWFRRRPNEVYLEKVE